MLSGADGPVPRWMDGRADMAENVLKYRPSRDGGDDRKQGKYPPSTVKVTAG